MSEQLNRQSETVSTNVNQTSEKNPIQSQIVKPKKSKKKIFIILVLLLVVGSVAVAKIVSMKNAASPMLTTAKVTKSSISNSISATGTVQGSDSAEIGSALSLEVVKINVKEGDKVKKGDILGTLDSDSLRDDYNMAVKELEISKAQLEEQQTTAKIAVQERQLDFNEAKRQNEIAKSLYNDGGISKDEMVQSNMALEKATLALANAKDALSRASASGSAALGLDIKKQLIESKKENLDKTNLTSPIDGTVTRVNAKLGRIPSSQDQVRGLFIVENLEDLIIKVSISEYDISNVKVGQKVKITSDVLRGESVDGVVSRIAPTGESAQGTSTTEMRIPVEIQITKKGKIIAGVSAKTEIILEGKDDVLVVPIEAVFEEEGKKYVLLGNENVIKKVEVKTGIEGLTDVELISTEIKDGDTIITNPTSEIKDGSSYRVQE